MLGCDSVDPGDEHVVLECRGLHEIRDRRLGLFVEHASTMVQIMWLDVIRGVAIFIKECLGLYHGIDPDRIPASDQPWVAGKDVKCVSLS